MTKMMFLLSLHDRLSGFSYEDVEERLCFYSEMIEDRMEEGLSEEDAVAAVGTVEQIAAQIEAELTALKPAKEKTKPKKRRNALKIVLLAVGAPIWLSMLIAAFAVLITLYAALWAVIASLWAVFCSLIGCILGAIVMGIVFFVEGKIAAGIAMIGVGIVCAGLTIFMFYGCKAATEGVLLLTKKIASGIKKCFTPKEEV